MLNINEINNQTILNTSLNSLFNNLKATGDLKVYDLYLLNLIYKLLNNQNLELSEIQKKILKSFYIKLYMYSNICKITENTNIVYPSIKTFEQADYTDCNDVNTFPKIYFWQYDDLLLDNNFIQNDILTNNYFINKQFDTYINFENSKNINYSNIGRICFAAFNSNNSNFLIKNELNLLINDHFDITYIPLLNCTLFVSKNIYSNSTINFKIIKT